VSVQFAFKGRILDDNQVKKIIEIAPAIFIRYMVAYLNYAGKTFIGAKEKGRGKHTSRTGRVYDRNVTSFNDGYLRNLLNNLPAARGGSWQRNFVNAAANYRIDKNRLEMRAGIIYTEKKKIHEIMEQMESGFTRNSSGYMIIPNYKALNKYSDSNKKPIGIFGDMIDRNELTMIFKGGNVYYIHKNTNELMFVGTKKIKVQKQWDFNSAYEAVRPQIEKKARTVIDRATKAATKKEMADSASID
jgi:hypothetical protein